MLEATMKTCIKCDESKPLDEFHRRSVSRDGRRGSCNVCRNAQQVAWQATVPDYVRRKNLKHNHDITPEQFDDLLAAQNGKCACCFTSEPGGSHGIFNVDHNHETGQIRGLLCWDCNVAIGKLGDTLEGVERAVAYMRRAA